MGGCPTSVMTQAMLLGVRGLEVEGKEVRGNGEWRMAVGEEVVFRLLGRISDYVILYTSLRIHYLCPFIVSHV